MRLLPGMIEAGCEGNISWFTNRQEKMVELISEIKPKNIIEIGFNVGHSAVLICELISKLKKSDPKYASQKVNMYVFDICVCEATKPNVEVLKEVFKDDIKIELIEGSSLETIPPFIQKNNIKFDFIEIDGCHTYDCLRQDVFNTLNNLSDSGVIYIDDYKSTQYPLSDVDRGVESIDWTGFDTNFVDGVFWAKRQMKKVEVVEEKDWIRPAHYGGKDNPYEVIKVCEAWGLDEDAYLFNVVKYVARAGKKDKNKEIEDLEKAAVYLDRKIKRLKSS